MPLNDYRVVSFMLAPGLLGLLGGEWKTPFFGRDVLAPATHPPLALVVYNKRCYGMFEGDDFLVLSDRKPSAFRIMSQFRLEPAELTPHRTRIASEGLET